MSDTVNVTTRRIHSLDQGSDRAKTPNRFTEYAAVDIPCGITFDFKHSEAIGSGPKSGYIGVMNWRSYGSTTDYSGGPTLQLCYDTKGDLWKRIHKTDRINNIFDWESWVRLATTADLPSVSDKKITLTAGKGLTDGGSFTLNQASDATITFNVGQGTGISVTDGAVGLATSGVTAGTYGQESTKTLTYSDTFTVPVVTVDTYGRVTSANEYTLTLPAADNTDTKNTTGSTTSTDKLYLVGAKLQTDDAVTYSSSSLYAQNGALTATEYNINTSAKIKYDTSAKCIRFVIN
jgi:hypothetical protein